MIKIGCHKDRSKRKEKKERSSNDKNKMSELFMNNKNSYPIVIYE